MKPEKILHVHLMQPFEGKNDFYFGSLAAMYATLNRDILGIPKSSAYKKLRGTDFSYVTTPKGSIIRSKLIRYRGK